MVFNARIFTCRAVAVGWSGYLQSLLQGFNIHLPAIIASAPGVGKGGLIDLPAVCILLLITGLLSFGIRESARINNIMVLIKLAVIIAFIVAGAKYVKPENWTPFIPFGYDGIITGAATVFFAFLGFDAIATAAEETKTAARLTNWYYRFASYLYCFIYDCIFRFNRYGSLYAIRRF